MTDGHSRPQGQPAEGASSFLAAICPGCKRPLLEAPSRWGAPVVHELAGKRNASGSGALRHCRCGAWVEIHWLPRAA
jgi:hypothetical protein